MGRRTHWVYFLWTPDTMSHEHNKGKIRMKHVSYNGAMQRLLAPWTVSLTVEHLEKVTISNWIMRVKKTVVVDGNDDFSEEAFKKALEEENKYILEIKQKEKERAEQRKKEKLRKREEFDTKKRKKRDCKNWKENESKKRNNKKMRRVSCHQKRAKK